jgi:2,5-diketo-D-gluconate reductase A
MIQCQGHTHRGYRCQRMCRVSNYCQQHQQQGRGAQHSIPMLGYGTFIGVEYKKLETDIRHQMTQQLIYDALSLGYRLFDTAVSYDNLSDIGHGLQRFFKLHPEVHRSDIYLIGKGNYSSDIITTIEQVFQCSSNQVGKGDCYLDLFLWHRPKDLYNGNLTIWDQLNQVQKSGYVKNIGVSNVYQKGLQTLITYAQNHALSKPYANEVEITIFNQEPDLNTFCQRNQIQLIGYSPLCYNYTDMCLDVDEVKKIAQQHQVRPAQIILSFLMSSGVVVIPSTRDKIKLKDNLEATQIQLTKDEIQVLKTLNTGLILTGMATHFKQLEDQTGGQDPQPPIEYKKDAGSLMSGFKDVLRGILTVIKITGGAAAMVGTMGAGGDTLVESVITTINSGLFYTELTQTLATLASNSQYVQQLIQISFENGPSKVKEETIRIVKQMIQEGNQSMLESVCHTFDDLLKSVATVVGDWISTFIPDDAGIVGTTVTLIINTAADKAFGILETLFNTVPEKFQDLLKHPQKLYDFLISILRMLEEGLREKGPTTNEMTFKATIGRLKKIGKQIVPGAALAEKFGIDEKILDMVFGIIKNYFEPNIQRAVSVAGQVMPLIFVILSLKQICGNPDWIKEQAETQITTVTPSRAPVPYTAQVPYTTQVPYTPIQYRAPIPYGTPTNVPQPIPIPNVQPRPIPNVQPSISPV